MTKAKNFLFAKINMYSHDPSLLEGLCNENYGPSVIFQPMQIVVIVWNKCTVKSQEGFFPLVG